MNASLIQLEHGGAHGVAVAGDGGARRVDGVSTILELAEKALVAKRSLIECAREMAGDVIDLHACRLLPAIIHPDPHRVLVSGTGLTHLGSAEGRDKMHQAATAGTTDSMRMFQLGLKGGKPSEDKIGAQPEWFYKGDGSILVGPDEALVMPGFAEDGGEEPEIAGIYLVDANGVPHRLGFVLGNEFSDHIVERQNYLWLAHSKLRAAAIGAELITGPLPEHIKGVSRIRRGNERLWEKPFLSGEANMSHSIANLEHHHFKNRQFRAPGSVHVHFFGTATLSFAEGIRTEAGDVFEIEADAFRYPLRNPLAVEQAAGPERVAVL